MKQLARVLRQPNFRWLFVAESVSVVGDRLVVVALALFVVDLTGSATDLGLVLAAHGLPFVGFLLIGGVWADRLPRQQLMIATDLTRFALHALLAVLIFTREVEIWHVVLIEALFGTAEAFFRPAYTGLIPQTVPEDMIQEANAVTATANNLAEFLGPALATALVVGLGAGWAFTLDAATFLVSAGFLLLVRPRERAEARVRRTLLTELIEGWREVRSRAWVWVTIAVFSFALLVGLAPFFVLGPVIAEQDYGGSGFYGVAMAAFGAGTVAGSLLAIRWRPRRPLRTAFVVTLPWALNLALYALSTPKAVVLPSMVVAGAGIAMFIVWWETALAQRIPPHALSRVTSYDWMGSLGLMPLGYLAAGPLAGALGADTVLLAGGLLGGVALLIGFLPRETRELGRVEPQAASATAEVRAGA